MMMYFQLSCEKGYSGTAIFTKVKPLSVTYGIGIEEHDQEGRVITAEFEKFYLSDGLYTKCKTRLISSSVPTRYGKMIFSRTSRN